MFRGITEDNNMQTNFAIATKSPSFEYPEHHIYRHLNSITSLGLQKSYSVELHGRIIMHLRIFFQPR